MAEFSPAISAYLDKLFGEDAARKFSDFIEKEPAQYIRVNKIKTSAPELASVLEKDYGIISRQVPGIQNVLKLSGRTDLTGKTIEHIIGEYYIQGLSSMIPPLVLNPSEDDIVMDLCAAPGSKTTGLAELMNNRGTLIANEIALNRAMALLYNIERMNILNTGVLHFKGEQLSKIYDNYFDKILVDAPCSGLGILQKKDEVNDWWSEERVRNLGELQLKLLVTAIKMLKPGGEIVYSTCTLTPEENEGVIDKILNKYPVELSDFELPLISHEGFPEFDGVRFNEQVKKTKRIFPWEADTDGFFIAKIKKTGDTRTLEPAQLRPGDFKFVSPLGKELKSVLGKLSETFGIPVEILNSYKYHMRGNDIYFVSGQWSDKNPGIFERVGTRFGIFDKHGEITFHSQAAQILQKFITKNIYSLEGLDEFKKYIEGGTIKIDIPPGQYVVKYKNYILGTAVSTREGLKSRFPRAKRTQGIYF
jgi:16S rRNA (cytosine1407-C5)-methyltransferase